MGFESWRRYFEANPVRQAALEAEIDWDAPLTLGDRDRRALIRSFQRFELGESGDGERLLVKAAATRDADYLAAVRLLVAEEQRHSALFARGLERLGGDPLGAHWSDRAFTSLRRLLGLRTEIALFLIAETIAVGYFHALARAAPDPVLRGIGRRILTDERQHVRFQVARLRHDFRSTPRLVRDAVGACWWLVAVGAATVLVLDHRGALRACGLRPLAYWGKSLRQFGRAARVALRLEPERG